MITIYKTGEQGLEVLDEVTKGCWINVVDPTPEELAPAARACRAARSSSPTRWTWTNDRASSARTGRP